MVLSSILALALMRNSSTHRHGTGNSRLLTVAMLIGLLALLSLGVLGQQNIAAPTIQDSAHIHSTRTSPLLSHVNGDLVQYNMLLSFDGTLALIRAVLMCKRSGQIGADPCNPVHPVMPCSGSTDPIAPISRSIVPWNRAVDNVGQLQSKSDRADQHPAMIRSADVHSPITMEH